MLMIERMEELVAKWREAATVNKEEFDPAVAAVYKGCARDLRAVLSSHDDGEKTINIYDRINELSVAQMRSRLALVYQYTQFAALNEELPLPEEHVEQIAEMILCDDVSGEESPDWIKP